jgi:ABC-type cobalt transport system, permease component CbiQ and related transporters
MFPFKKRRSALVGFVPGDTWVHMLDPRTKLFAIVVICLATLAVTSPSLMAVPFLFVILLTLVSHLGRHLLRALAAFSPLLAVILILDLFFAAVEPGTLYASVNFGFFTLDFYSGRLLFALAMGLRLLSIAAISLLFIMTTDYSAFVRSLKAMHVPDSISFSLGYALRSTTTMWKDAHHIADSQRSRGLEFDRSVLTKNRNRLMALTVPVAVSVLNRSGKVSESMLSRGYGYSERPTYHNTPEFSMYDAILILSLCNMLMVEYICIIYSG